MVKGEQLAQILQFTGNQLPSDIYLLLTFSAATRACLLRSMLDCSLERNSSLVSRKEFLERCESWRLAKTSSHRPRPHSPSRKLELDASTALLSCHASPPTHPGTPIHDSHAAQRPAAVTEGRARAEL